VEQSAGGGLAVTCEKIETPFGVAIVCTRGRKPPKCNCSDQVTGGTLKIPCIKKPELQCDKCDRYVCDVHSVCVKLQGAERDFCARCFLDVWKHWCRVVMAELLDEAVRPSRHERRVAFREWAAKHPEAFAGLKLSKKAQASP
jgi:hypothetical protein